MLKKLFPIIRTSLLSNKITFNSNRNYGIYEPDYLESLKPKFPLYKTLNFRITGYDFPILESYQKFVHGVAKYLELDVSDCYAYPPKKLRVQKFKKGTAAVEHEYKLTIYERNILINDLEAPIYPIFLRTIEAALPEGVTLNVVEHNNELEDMRYVPDQDLKELRSQLEVLQGKTPQKNK